MLEFLKNYWELVLCGVLIIVVIVLLIVFRDKPEKVENASDSQAKDETENKTQEQPETEQTQEQPVEQKTKKEKVKAKKTQPENEEVEQISESETKQEEVEQKPVEDTKEQKQVEQSETEQVSDEEKAKLQKYMVTYDKEQDVWVIKKTGAKRASKLCKTKKEAMEVVKKLADNQDLNISVKKKDGKFQKRGNASK